MTGTLVRLPIERVFEVVGRRREAAGVVRALPDLLERVGSGLRAGAAPLVALAEAAACTDLPPALAGELRRVVECAKEQGFEQALAGWAEDRPDPAVCATAAALQVTVAAGGPAASALDGLAAGLRDRQDTAGEVAALSAQGRLSAIVVGAAPFVSLALSLVVDRRVAPSLVATPSGRTCLLTGLTLEALAGLWMRRILRCPMTADSPTSTGVPGFQGLELGNAGCRRRRRPASEREAGAVPGAEDVALAADVIAMALLAGLTPFLTVEVTARVGPRSVAGPLAAVLEAANGGARLADALDAEGLRSASLRPVLALLAASERTGAPAAAALGRLAAQIRAQARRQALTRARTVPVRLLFPLVFLVLPAFLLLTVAPVVLASLSG